MQPKEGLEAPFCGLVRNNAEADRFVDVQS